jgi:hypothetical protein
MRRLLALALVALSLSAAEASANGWYTNPGYLKLNGGISLSFGSTNCRQPYQLGPWYQYWPYEAHFQQPALPQYPYWGAQGLPNGLPHIRPGQPGYGPPPPYWGN